MPVATGGGRLKLLTPVKPSCDTVAASVGAVPGATLTMRRWPPARGGAGARRGAVPEGGRVARAGGAGAGGGFVAGRRRAGVEFAGPAAGSRFGPAPAPAGGVGGGTGADRGGARVCPRARS